MEPRPIYLIHQNDGTATVEEPPTLDAIRNAHRANPTYPRDALLALDIETLCDLARIAGASDVAIIRAATDPAISWTHAGADAHLHAADAGTLLIIRFPATDGRAPTVENRSYLH